MILEILLTFFSALFIYFFLLKGNPNGKKYPPGPMGVPIFGHLLQLGLAPHKKCLEWGKTYGKLFSIKFGVFDVVVFNDPLLLKNTFKEHVYCGRPSDKLLSLSLLAKGVAFNEGESVIQQRRFTLKALRDLGFGNKSQEVIMYQEVDEIKEYFKKRVGESIDVKPLLAVSIVNSVLYMLLGKKFSLDDPFTHKLIKANTDGINAGSTSLSNFIPWLPKVFPWLSSYTKLKAGMDVLETAFYEVIEEHWNTFDPDNLRDYVDNYINEIKNCTDPKSGFYKDEGKGNLCHTLIDLFSGGVDTSSSSVTWCILYFLHYPEALKKIQAELDQIVGRERYPSLDDRPKCHYTEAFMWEIWRIVTIVPSVFHSTLEQVEIEGYILPKRTIIFPNYYAANNDPKYLKDPEVFRPERFLTPEGKFKKIDTIAPFGTGKRSCIAESLGQAQNFIFLTCLAQSFNFTLPAGKSLPNFDADFGFVLTPHPFKVKVTLRD